MSELSWGLMGYKAESEKPYNIGRELVSQIDNAHKRLGLESSPRFILRKSGLTIPAGENYLSRPNLDALEDREFPDVVFVALPSTEDGEPATSLIEKSLERGAKVVTCEKGALANNFQQLKNVSKEFGRLGINATVGGGTRMMEKSKADLRDPDNVHEIHMAVNGTLTHIFSSVGPRAGKPTSPGQAVSEAVSLGYAEPGATDINSVIRSEAEGDVPKKIAIFMNQSGLLEEEDCVDWREFEFQEKLSDELVHTTLEEAKIRRFIVSIYPDSNEQGPEKDIIGGFDTVHGRWRVVGGFRNIDRNVILHDLAELTNCGNGMITALGPQSESDGINIIAGPGAGPKPTVNAMLDDYLKLVNN